MSTVVRPLIPRLVAPQLACDYEFMASRLADPSLLAGAVGVCLHRMPLLAVPVGGLRQGGYMSLDLLILAEKTRNLLDGLPGFPELRVLPSPYRHTCHVEEWGGRPPVCDDVARGRFYGYSKAAITGFRSGHGPPTPSSTAGQLSPTMP